MRFDGHDFAVRHRRWLILAALLTTFASADLILVPPKGSWLELLAVPLLVVGAVLFAWSVWPRGVLPKSMRASLSSRLISWLTVRGRLVPYLPIIGVGLVAADLGYNATVSATPALLTEDIIVLLAAATLIIYNFVPARFARERDFVLTFFLALNAILVAPLALARAWYQNFEQSVDLYSWVALAPETSAILNVVGVANSVHQVAGTTAPGLTFIPTAMGTPVTVVITTACSGIYSFGIFASAFLAFVLTEYERPSRRIFVFLGLGLAAAYVANVLRMVGIVLVGYYTDTQQTALQNMLLAHSYLGWIVFIGWIGLFWAILLKFLPAENPRTALEIPPVQVAGPGRCGICRGALTPAIPASRCACGAFHHRKCLGREGHCPTCGRDWSTGASAVEAT